MTELKNNNKINSGENEKEIQNQNNQSTEDQILESDLLETIPPDISVEQLFQLSIRVSEKRKRIAMEIEKLKSKKAELAPQLDKLMQIIKPKSKIKSKLKSIGLEKKGMDKVQKLEVKLAISSLKRELFIINENLALLTKQYSKVVGSEIKTNKIQKLRDQAQSKRFCTKSISWLEKAIIQSLNKLIAEQLEEVKMLQEFATNDESVEKFKNLLLDLLKEIDDDKVFIFCSTKNSQEMLLPAIRETLQTWNQVSKIETLRFPDKVTAN